MEEFLIRKLQSNQDFLNICNMEIAFSQIAGLHLHLLTKGKTQMSAKEVQQSRRICNVRIHVEHVIGRLKNFKILDSIIPMTQVKMLDNVMAVISAITNLNKSVVS